MTLIGVRTQKLDGERLSENRYFLDAESMDAAETLAGQLVLIEKQIFGTQVSFDNIHLWQVGASPRRFRNVPISGFGAWDGANPLSPEIVLRVSFGTDDANPYYKDFRTRVASGNIIGDLWAASYLAAVLLAMEDLAEMVSGGYVVTKTGDPLTDPTVDTHYRFRQLHPRWYNRAP
jgi:hypothetical protein